MAGATGVLGYMGGAGVWRLPRPAETGSRRPSFGVSEDRKMIETLGYGANIVSSGLNADLRTYARWEYNRADAEWILSTARRPRNVVRPRRSWALRARYWLNSFRGFATYDVRGTDGRV